MTRRRNFLPLAGFLVCAVAFLSYPSFFARFEWTRDVPWVNWLLFALGFALLGAGLLRAFGAPERTGGRISGPILGVLSLAVLGLFLHVTLIASRELPASARAPGIGEKAPEFTLLDAERRPVRLSELLGGPARSWLLLIFYRGYW